MKENKENIDTNIPTVDIWYKVNRVLEKNGYAKISMNNKSDPSTVCNSVLEILHNYEQRGETIQKLLTEKREFGYQGAAARANDIEIRNKIASLEENNSTLKAKIKRLEYDLKQGKQLSKRKEWGKNNEDTAKLESQLKNLKLK